MNARHTGEGLYLWQKRIPAFAGTTTLHDCLGLPQRTLDVRS